MSSSVEWLDTKNKTQQLWFRKYIAKNYPGTYKAIIETPNIGDRMFVSEFKKNIGKYWGEPSERVQKVIKLRNAWYKKKSRSGAKCSTLSIDVSPELLEQFTSLAKGITHAELLSNLIKVFNVEQGDSDIFETVTQKKEKRNEVDKLQQEVITLKSELYQKNQMIEELEKMNKKYKSTRKNSEENSNHDTQSEDASPFNKEGLMDKLMKIQLIDNNQTTSGN